MIMSTATASSTAAVVPVLMLQAARYDHSRSNTPFHLPCSGAFKFRGACNAVQALSGEDAQKVVH